MKVVITGASGFVATELLRQSLRHPAISSVVAISRRPVAQPTGLPASESGKLHVVQVKDYGELDVEEVREAVAGAEGCIWYESCPCFHHARAWFSPLEEENTSLPVDERWQKLTLQAHRPTGPSPSPPPSNPP